MKIAIDARESGTSSGRYVDKLIEHIHKLSPAHEFVIITKSHQVDFIRSIAPTFAIRVADFKEFTFSEQLGFLRFCRKIEADLVHFPMVHQPILYAGKKITTINDLTTLRFRNPAKNPAVFWAKQRVYALVNHVAARSSSHLLTFTDYVKQDFMHYSGVSEHKITAVPLAADKIPEKMSPIKRLQGKQFIMYTGRPLPHKNLGRLIDSFTLLQKEHPNLRLVLVGKTDALYQKHRHYVEEQGIKHVVFTGFVGDGELKWLYKNCAAYVFPSLSEGFGLPGLEAMVHDAPVVSSSASCLPEVNGDAAHYFDPESIDDMAAKIHDVLSDSKLRSTLIERGRRQAKKYSWQQTAKQTLAAYEKVLGD